MAPELFQDEGVYSFASDLWALGCVLYELATGKPPFTSSSFQELVNMIVNSDLPIVGKYSKGFNDLIFNLLEKDPAKRLNWDQLIYHPWWAPYEFQDIKYPNEPQFEEYLKKKNGTKSTPQSTTNERDRSPGLNSKTSFPVMETNNTQGDLQVGNKEKKNVDVVRMSHNIMKNMIKEAQQNSGYEEKEPSEQLGTEQNDIKLTNHNQELNFADGGDDEEDDENKESENADSKPEENVEEEKVENQNLTKIEFSKKKDSTPTSEKTSTLTKVVSRNLKPETDEMSITPKNGRSNQNLNEDAEKLATANFLTNQKSQPKISDTDKNKKVPPIDQLLIHTSDTVVKPITGNKEIEKPMESSFNREMLTFNPMIPEDIVKGIETTQVENHLAEIYNYISSNSPNVLDKLNALNYFEIIIQNSAVANRLVNSAFMSLLVKVAKTTKNMSLRIKICIIIGHLIRHATVIENELSQLGIPAVMAEIMKDKNEKVRRKAAAALGEYLFYGATQIDEDASNSVWELSSTIIALLLKTIKANEDDIVKFYACKTIENITAQSVTVGTKFANLEFASAFFSVYSTTKNEGLKICCAVTLGHISRLNSVLTWPILEKFTLRHICGSFTDANARIQQVFVTMINQYLQSGGSKVYTTLAEESSLIPSLIGLLDHSAVVIRGKCLLTFYLMFKTNLKWMMALSENKFGTLLDRLSRDAYRYVQCCLIHLLDLITDLIPIILKNVEEELQGLKKKLGSISEEEAGNKEYLTNYLGLMPIILGVMNSLLLRNKIVNNNFLLVMFKIYDLSEDTKAILNDDFRTTVFMIFESFSSNHKLLIANYEIVLKILFPNLLSKITSENADSRFNGLKLITDILIQYLNEETIYEPSGQKTSAKLINEIISSELLPNIKFILNDQEPMPLYGLKLFSIVIGKNINFVAKLKQNNMIKLFLEYFNSNHPRLTSNTLKIIVKIVESKDISLDDLTSFSFLAKAVQIFKYFFSNSQEWCYEELLDIFNNYLNKILDTIKDLKVNVINIDTTYNPTILTDKQALTIIKANDAFLEILDIFISLSNHAELIIADKSLTCLISTLYIFGAVKKDKTIAKPDQVASLLNILSLANKQSVWKRTAKALLWIAHLQEYQIFIPADKKGLIALLDKHKNSEDKTISFCCK